MGLLSRGPEKVIEGGRRVRGRIVGLDVTEKTVNDSEVRIDEYVVELGPTEGGRRFGLRQVLGPDNYVRLGMEVSAWVREDDMFIDWAGTLAEQGVHTSNDLKGWKADRDATRVGVTDSRVKIEKAAKKGEAGSMAITDLRWDSRLGGLLTSLTISGRVSLGSDEPYEVEIGRQHVPFYASHLPTVGRVVPVIVAEKRLDRVKIDWPSAVAADPGIGVPPVSDASVPRGAPTSISMGAATSWVPPVVDDDGFTPPDPIEGISWAQYLTIEKAILDSGGYGRKTGELLRSLGVDEKTYSVASAGFGKLMMRDPELQIVHMAAMYDD